MKKLNLDLEALIVESFATSDAPRARGTVHANAPSDTTCAQRICGCPTGGGATCLQTCYESCYGTCGENTCQNTCADTCPIGCGTVTMNLTVCNAPLSLCVCTPGGTCYEDTDFC